MLDKVDPLLPITTHQAFLHFLKLLQVDFHEQGNQWGNGTLPDYLEAIEAWTTDMEEYYVNTGQPIPENVPWQVFADILRAARGYE
jgi:hypothetical protein